MPNPDMPFVERVFSFIDDLELERAGSATVRQIIGSMAAECGYEYYTITRLPQPRLRLGPAMVIKIWPAPWLSHYDRSGYYKHDPIGQHCFETLEPFLWSDVHYPSDDKMAARVMGEAAEHGLRQGYCVPLYGYSGFQAVASYTGLNPELSSRRRSALHLLSIAAYGWAERQEGARRNAEGSALSPRERDVLTWTALGLTDAQIADRLRVSIVTIRTHQERARLKLDAVNRVSAVVEALRRREIRI